METLIQCNKDVTKYDNNVAKCKKISKTEAVT